MRVFEYSIFEEDRLAGLGLLGTGRGNGEGRDRGRKWNGTGRAQYLCRDDALLFAANASHALDIGTLTMRTDHHLTRVPLHVGEEGWKDLGEAYGELLERVFVIQEESAERLGEQTEDPGISTISFQAFFEMPKSRPSTKEGGSN